MNDDNPAVTGQAHVEFERGRPASNALENAASVFSGAIRAAPRWAAT